MNYFEERFPKTLASAIENLAQRFSFQERTRVVNFSERQLVVFHHTYGRFIRTEFGLPGNGPLMQSCREFAGLPELGAIHASYVILKELQNSIQRF